MIIYNIKKIIAAIRRIVYWFGVTSLLFISYAQTNSNTHINVDSLVSSLNSLNIKTYYWNIRNTNDWNDLHTFLPKAKVSGITVCVTLQPPSKTPPVNPAGTYSQPYQLDYVTWAKQIAALSLRYSNLTAYDISDYRENLDFSYLKQSNMNSVIAAGTAINPKLQFLTNLPNLFYVDKNATGNGNGSSWTNAAKSFTAVHWSYVKGGDTVYVSGGTDSTVYTTPLQPKANGTPTKKIITTRGKDPGHNGIPIFSGSYANIALALQIDSVNYMEISYLKFVNGTTGGALAAIEDEYGVDILHCTFIHPTGAAIHIEASDRVRIMYNTIMSTQVSDSDETDAIWMGYGSNIEIAYNFILEQNYNLGDAHNDIVQGYQWQLADTGITRIHHNFLVQYSKQGQLSHSDIIYLNQMGGYYQIYDNIMLDNGTFGDMLGLVAQNWSTTPTSHIYAQVYNNTFEDLVTVVDTRVCQFYGVDSLRFENNAILQLNAATIPLYVSGGTQTGYLNVDYNLYKTTDTSKFCYINESLSGEGTIGWGKWKSVIKGEKHSSVKGFSIIKDSSLTQSDYALNVGSNGIDAGTTLTLFNDDYFGTIRPLGLAWDIGAVESH
jgi:hypothetical protein